MARSATKYTHMCIYTYTAWLYELAFTVMRSVSGYCCKLSNVKLGWALDE